MTELSSQDKHITLGDDGELHQILDAPSLRKDAIFCVHCSAPNYPSAKFCNECGKSLLEQQADTPISEQSDAIKRKNNQGTEPKLATYDPRLYELRLRSQPTNLVGIGLFLGLMVISSVLVTFIVAVEKNPAECLLIEFPLAIVVAIWWSIQRRNFKSTFRR